MSSWRANLGLNLAYGASGATGGPSHMPGRTGGRASPRPRWAPWLHFHCNGRCASTTQVLLRSLVVSVSSVSSSMVHGIRFCVCELHIRWMVRTVWPKCPAARGTKSGARQAPPFCHEAGRGQGWPTPARGRTTVGGSACTEAKSSLPAAQPYGSEVWPVGLTTASNGRSVHPSVIVSTLRNVP